MSAGRIDWAVLKRTNSAQEPLDAGDRLLVGIDGVGLPPVDANTAAETASGAESTAAGPSGFPTAVESDGTLRLPLVEPVDVRGLTLAEAERRCTLAYGDAGLGFDAARDRVRLTRKEGRSIRVLVSSRLPMADQPAPAADADSKANAAVAARPAGSEPASAPSSAGIRSDWQTVGVPPGAQVVTLRAGANDVYHALAAAKLLETLSPSSVIHVVRPSGRSRSASTTAPKESHRAEHRAAPVALPAVPRGMPAGRSAASSNPVRLTTIGDIGDFDQPAVSPPQAPSGPALFQPASSARYATPLAPPADAGSVGHEGVAESEPHNAAVGGGQTTAAPYALPAGAPPGAIPDWIGSHSYRASPGPSQLGGGAGSYRFVRPAASMPTYVVVHTPQTVGTPHLTRSPARELSTAPATRADTTTLSPLASPSDPSAVASVRIPLCDVLRSAADPHDAGRPLVSDGDVTLYDGDIVCIESPELPATRASASDGASVRKESSSSRVADGRSSNKAAKRAPAARPEPRRRADASD